MAQGDYVAYINRAQYDGVAFAYTWCRLVDDYHIALLGNILSGDLSILNYAPDGTVTYERQTSQNMSPPGYNIFYSTGIIHATGTTYLLTGTMRTDAGATYGVCIWTWTIADDGATDSYGGYMYKFAVLKNIKSNCLYKMGNHIVMPFLGIAGTTNYRIDTILVTDGSTVSVVDSLSALANTQATDYKFQPVKVSETVLAVATVVGGTITVDSYVIDGSGNITLADSKAFAGAVVTDIIDGGCCPTANVAAFLCDSGAATKIITVSVDGTSGAIGASLLDSEVFTGIDATYSAREDGMVAVDNVIVCNLATGTSTCTPRIFTSTVSTDGIITPVSNNMPAGTTLYNYGYGNLMVLEGDVFAINCKDGSSNCWVATFTVEHEPLLASVSDRIGSIHHIYRPGYYRAKIKLGGYETQLNAPLTYRDVDIDEEIMKKLERDPLKTAQDIMKKLMDRDTTPLHTLNAVKTAAPRSNTGLSDAARFLNEQTRRRNNIIRLPTNVAKEVTDAIYDDIRIGDILE